MYLSTFKEEAIVQESELIIKSLFILTFISPNKLTNYYIEHSPYKNELEQIRYNKIVSKYSFLSLVNPQGWNLISKNLPEPNKRNGIQEDFLMVETNTLHNYLRIVDIISSTIALN